MPPEPSLIISEDSREQKYLDFNRFKHVLWQQIDCLPVGDYMAIINGGSPSFVYFERKSISDLWGTMASKNYERFKREFNKSLELGIKLVLIIEGTISEVNKGFSYNGRRSKFLGSSMTKKLETLRVKHGLEVVYCDGRTDMKRYIYERWLAEARLELKK